MPCSRPDAEGVDITLKTNDVILHMVTKVVVFIILTLAVHLFFAGHNNPGGGFIAGLVLSSAVILLLLASDIETVKKSLPLNFITIAAIGALLAVSTGLGAVIFGDSFLTQTFSQFNIPLLGVKELSTVLIFEAGVALTVLGVTLTIILSISEDM